MKNRQQNGCSLNQWAQVIAESSFVQPDKIPEGWFTVNDIAKATNVSNTTASRHARLLVANGKAERKSFRLRNGERGVYPVPHFRLL